MTNKPISSNNLLFLIFILGLASIISQVIILREFLFAFGGNELIMGLFLSVWMLITGIGSFSGRYAGIKTSGLSRALLGLMTIGCLPLLLLAIVDVFRNIIFIPGSQPGVIPILLCMLVILSVYCFVSGFTFIRLTSFIKQTNNQVGFLNRAYAVESIGSMTGGVVFSFILAFVLDNFEASCVVAAITLVSILFLSRQHLSKISRILMMVLFVPVFIYFLFFNASQTIRQFLFPAQEIVETRDTRYGNLTVTRLSDQLNFYQNNLMLFTTDNQMANEEAVHYAMAQHFRPEKVLLISGGITGLTNEILKYNSVELIDYLEIDPAVFKIGKDLTESLNHDKIRTYNSDARRFINKTPYHYDVVIINMPEPSTLELNRYYTLSFYSALKNKLSPHGIITFSLPATINYLNNPSLKMNASVYNTCKAIFNEVKIYPCGNNIYVASNDSLSYNIGELIEYKNIATDYVNQYYLDERSMTSRAEVILADFQTEKEINTDFKPIAIYNLIQYWLSQFQVKVSTYSAVMVVLLIILTGIFFFIKPVYPGMFTAGFTASSFQVLLLISFQVVIGHVYQSLGVFVAVFMAGLGFGAIFRHRLFPKINIKNYAMLQIILAVISFIIPFIILFTSAIFQYTFWVYVLFFFMILCVSVFTGILFSASLELANHKMNNRIALIYGTDMTGASLGAFITTLYFIPVAGIINTAFICAALNLIFAANSLIKRNSE